MNRLFMLLVLAPLLGCNLFTEVGSVVADMGASDASRDIGDDGGQDTDIPLPDGMPIPVNSIVTADAPDVIVVTFDRRIQVEDTNGFTIHGGDDHAVTLLTANGRTLALQLSKPITYYQQAITWSYDAEQGGVKNLPTTLLVHVDNQIPLPEPKAQYYVTPTGNADNDGLSEATAWSFDFATTQVAPGDKVWVKAGVYYDVNVTFEKRGEVDAPIVFEGYKTGPGGERIEITKLYYEYGPNVELDPSELPTFIGSGTAFDLGGAQDLVFRNLQFSGYGRAIFSRIFTDAPGSTEFAVKRTLIERVFAKGGTSGVSAVVLGERSLNAFITVRDSVSLNMGGTGFGVFGRGNLVASNRVFSDQDVNTTNYGIALGGTGNVFANNLIHRVNASSESTIGFFIQGVGDAPTEQNLVKDSTVINVSGAYTFSGELCSLNVVRDCTAVADGAINGESTGGIKFTEGPHHNLVERFSAQGVSIAIGFGAHESASAGHDNLIRNSEFYGVPAAEGTNGYSHKHAIHGSSTTTPPAVIANNTFVNCTFHDFSYFLRFYPAPLEYGVKTRDNRVVNCSISEGLYFKHPDTIDDAGFVFENNNMFQADTRDQGFQTFIGSAGNFSEDPRYGDFQAFDFSLRADSPNINAGIDRPDVTHDIQGMERDKNDVGAFEFVGF